MEYSSISLKNGLLQDIEFWAGLQDGEITDNALLKAQITSRLNIRYARALAKVGGKSEQSRVDDSNYTNQPFSLFTITSGQNDYQFLTDADGNAVTDITAVLILESTTATEFRKLGRLTLDNPNAELIMSPNPSNTGIPSKFLERNNTIFFDCLPNYTKEGGGKLFYKRAPSFFVVGDTTKQPGFDSDHHPMLSMQTAYDYLLAHNSGNTMLLTRLEAEMIKAEDEFALWCELRNPIRRVLSRAKQSFK